jgi:hypothetical protein
MAILFSITEHKSMYSEILRILVFSVFFSEKCFVTNLKPHRLSSKNINLMFLHLERRG